MNTPHNMEDTSHFLRILRTLPKSYQSNFIRNNIIKNCPEICNSDYYNVSQLCKACGRCYEIEPGKHKLLACKKLNRFLRRIRRKSFKCRTPYQIESFNKLKKYISSQSIVEICDNCYYVRRYYIKKIVKELDNIPNSPKKLKRAKKNKKINEYAGLNKNAVLSVKKTKLGSNNVDNFVTPKKKKLDEVIVLDTPTSNVCVIDDTDDSKSSTSNTNTTIINLVTPESKKCSNSPNANSTIINLVTPKSKKSNKKNQKLNNKSNTSINRTNQNNLLLAKSKKNGKKFTNVVLETGRKSAKKGKMNVLQSLINKTDISKFNQSSSSLQLFLQSIPSY